MTIAEFLLARIAEDEGVAQAVLVEQGERLKGATVAIPPASDPNVFAVTLANNFPVLCIDPGARLAECEAKRSIVALHNNPCPECLDARRCVPHDSSAGREGSGVVRFLDPADEYALRALASVYADHPDYRPEWAA